MTTSAPAEPRVSDDLVNELLGWHPTDASSDDANRMIWLMHKAARRILDDRATIAAQAEKIAGLEAENARLRRLAGLDSLGVNGVELLQKSYKTACERLVAAKARAEAAEASLASQAAEKKALVNALQWALDEIDALSNRLSQWAYPQGMSFLDRLDQADNYIAAIKAKNAALAATGAEDKAHG